MLKPAVGGFKCGITIHRNIIRLKVSGRTHLIFKTSKDNFIDMFLDLTFKFTGPHSAAGNVCCNRCESDCRSRGVEFDPSPVQYFRGD